MILSSLRVYFEFKKMSLMKKKRVFFGSVIYKEAWEAYLISIIFIDS